MNTADCKILCDPLSLGGRELEGGGKFTLTFPDLIGTPIEGEGFYMKLCGGLGDEFKGAYFCGQRRNTG
jgi:hypothetical protein